MSTKFSKVYACYMWIQWEIWLQKCKMDTKDNAMNMNPKHKWCMKRQIGQKLKNWKIFSFDQSSIDRIPIELDREQWLKIKGFSICQKHIQSIKILEIWIFEKTAKDYTETPQPK